MIALPDLQRPFVWEDTKVRDLLDSLFLGFPVGTLVLWHTSTDREARALGGDRPGLRATTLVIDGQQRLTSLFAVMRGVEVLDKDGAPRKITIAFRPRDGRFEVADAAIRKDPEFLANVTELWNGTRPKPQLRRDIINALRDKGRPVDETYEDAVERNLDRARSIADYRFPTVDIRKTAAMQAQEATEEDVAEIFVRINNQGTRLGQADFVLTLLADIIRVAFRQLGGEQDAPPLTPPWFLPGTEEVWRRIAETERALRAVVREVYVVRFGDSAAARIEAAVPERERQTLVRNLARRPAGAEPLSIVDYLYLAQLPMILFAHDVQQETRKRLAGGQDSKQRLLAAVDQIAPVRNEIAHVREIDRDRLLRATVACGEVLEMLKGQA